MIQRRAGIQKVFFSLSMLVLGCVCEVFTAIVTHTHELSQFDVSSCRCRNEKSFHAIDSHEVDCDLVLPLYFERIHDGIKSFILR